MNQKRATMGRTPREQPSAVIVGAGVSGCACAAVLAGQGVRVTLLNSALDRVGLPGYSPEMVAGPRGWREIGETMALLPPALRQAWLSSAMTPTSGVPVLLVDRRALSIETKRALELMPGLDFRQGLVTDLRIESHRTEGPEDSQDAGNAPDLPGLSDAQVDRTDMATVETVFGEVLKADAIILAVGLGLGGRIEVGADSLRAGRYGETPADGLQKALQVLGASFAEVTLQVGAWFPRDATGLLESLTGANGRHRLEQTVSLRGLLSEIASYGPGVEGPGLEEAGRVLAEALVDDSGGAAADPGAGYDPGAGWPDSYPPAAHWCDELLMARMIVACADDGAPVPLATPDGRATGEIHLSPDGESVLKRVKAAEVLSRNGLRDGQGAPASRLGHTVRAHIVTGLGPDGRLTLESTRGARIWVVGRAAGASSYLSSLRSGVLAAAAAARLLLGSGDEW